MSRPYTGLSSRMSTQSEAILGREADMERNSAGGFGFKLDDFKALERFLVLGSEGGSYYATEVKLTRENAVRSIRAIESDGARAVDLIVSVSEGGRAPKNDAAIFALALAASAKSPETRSRALGNLSRVCRIPTHLFHFVTYVKQFRGFGRGLKSAVAGWYQDMEVGKLAYEVVKYQSRDGWSNRDLLRLSHPKTGDGERNVVYKWITSGWGPAIDLAQRRNLLPGSLVIPEIIAAFEQAKKAEVSELIHLITKRGLSREMLPTEALKNPKVWEAMLPKMGLTALLRNLGNLGKCGLLTPLSDASRLVKARLLDQEALKKARVHPVSILIASKVYSSGRGVLGRGEWPVVGSVVDALDEAFYLAFDYVPPTGKNLLLAVDVSGSMSDSIAGIPNMSAAEGAAVMALACARIESDYEIVTFAREVQKQVKLTKSMRLNEVERAVSGNGGTDCSAPIRWALANKVKTDGIVILTDNETWAGSGHPSQHMRDYRAKVNVRARIINLGMTATELTINDPEDALSLDVAGFDANVPSLISDFMRESV